MRTLTVILVITLFLTSASGQEQIKKNVYSLGGSIYYSSSTTKANNYESTQTSYTIDPSVSYFVEDQFELLFSLGYMSYKQTNTPYENKGTSLALVLGMRLYFPAGKTAPFIGVSGGTSWSSFNSQPFSTPRTMYSLTGGLEIFIAPSAAIEPAIMYTKNRLDETYSISGIQFGIGVKYFIP